MDLEAINDSLRREADDLLYTRGLLTLLQRHGTPHVHGSYALGLMTWRDLDIYLVADALSIETFFALGSTIATTLEPVRMQFRNERLAQTPDLPVGLYWGVYLDGGDKDGWKVDLWAITSNRYNGMMAHHTMLSQRLTPTSRRTILELKTHYWRDPRYRRSLTSQDLYDAVLDYGIDDVAGIEQYLRQREQPI